MVQGMKPDLVASQYAKIRDVFALHGCDWIILSPHYVRPGPVEGWMGDEFVQVLHDSFDTFIAIPCLDERMTDMCVGPGKRSRN